MDELHLEHDERKSVHELSRREKRALIFQLLYTSESFDYQNSLESILDTYNRGFEFEIPLGCDVVEAVEGIIKDREVLDDAYRPLLSNWRFDRLGVGTKLILRYAIWELIHSKTDPTIVINEAVELAKCFAERDSFKFINGILDEFVKKLKPTE